MAGNLDKIDKALVLLGEVRDDIVGNTQVSSYMQNCAALAMRGLVETSGVLREAAKLLDAARNNASLLAKQFPDG